MNARWDLGLQREKLDQLSPLLRETGIDCWLVVVREPVQAPDPVLPIVLGADLVWPSAFLFTPEGDPIAIVGVLDAVAIPDALYPRIVPYTEGMADLLRGAGTDRSPLDRDRRESG